jgi:hypothetical protein
MKKWDRYAAMFFLAVGLGAMGMAWKIGFGTFQSPGPGFFPFWLAFCVSAVSVVFGVKSLGHDSTSIALWLPGVWRRPLKAIIIMFIYAQCIGQIGFITSSGLLFFTWLTFVEKATWRTRLLVTGFGVLGLYVFATALRVSLPAGLLP